MGNSIFNSFWRKEIDFVLILWTHVFVGPNFKMVICNNITVYYSHTKTSHQNSTPIGQNENLPTKTNSHDQMDLRIGFCTLF